MAYDRPSWKDIDRKRDGSGGGRRKRKDRESNQPKEHSTRYDRYKSDLNRLFDQGLAGELLKKEEKEPEPEPAPAKKKTEAKKEQPRRKNNSRIPKDSSKSASRFKLIRAIIDAEDRQAMLSAIEELLERFGMPDDWEVLGRVVDHPNEQYVQQAVAKMVFLLPHSAKIPRRASLKERLRTISQTASIPDLRQAAAELERKL